ncbi:MAG: hypothetical protein H0V44_05705 [Planctomycetes bacterium]|nr:hypothetical protein [Planctomycetota bacterium]
MAYASRWLTVSPEALLVLSAIIGMWTWTRCRRIGALIGVAVSFATAALVWGAEDGVLNWAAALAATALACGAWAAWRRRPLLLIAAAVALQASILLVPEVGSILRAHGLSVLAGIAAIAGLTTVISAISAPTLLPKHVVRLAGWMLMAGLLHCCLRERSALHAPILGCALLAATLCLAAWRCRDRGVLAPLLIPGGCALPYLIPANKAWLIIWAAFGLLGAALMIGHRRIRDARSHLAGGASAPVASELSAEPG